MLQLTEIDTCARSFGTRRLVVSRRKWTWWFARITVGLLGCFCRNRLIDVLKKSPCCRIFILSVVLLKLSKLFGFGGFPCFLSCGRNWSLSETKQTKKRANFCFFLCRSEEVYFFAGSVWCCLQRENTTWWPEFDHFCPHSLRTTCISQCRRDFKSLTTWKVKHLSGHRVLWLHLVVRVHTASFGSLPLKSLLKNTHTRWMLDV